MQKQPFAYTAPTGEGYPEYVNFTEADNGDLLITVRGPRRPASAECSYDRDGLTATMRLPAAEREAMLKALG